VLRVREGADLTEWSVANAHGAGGMFARFSDLGVWGASMLGNSLLPKALASKRIDIDSSSSPYGLGIVSYGEMVGPGEWYGHGGSILGWQSFVVHNPKSGATVAMLTSTCGVEISPHDLVKYIYPR